MFHFSTVCFPPSFCNPVDLTEKCKFHPQHCNNFRSAIVNQKFLHAGIHNVSTSISIFHNLIERYPEGNDGDESDKHI